MLIIPTAFAGEYYLAPNGDNSNDGLTPLTAKKTLNALREDVFPGDIIYMMEGIYTNDDSQDDYKISFSGTENNKVTVTNYNTDIVTIEQTYDIDDQSKATLKISGEYVTVSNIRVDAGYDVNNPTSPKVRGVHFGSDATGSIVDGLYITNSYYKGVGFSGDNQTLQNSEVTNCSLDNYHGAQGGSGWQQAVSTWETATNTTVRNNYVHENWGEGIDIIRSLGATIEGNVLHDNYSVNIYVDGGADIILKNNFIYRTTNVYDRMDKPNNWESHPIGISMANEQSGQLVKNITIGNNILMPDDNQDGTYYGGLKRGISFYNCEAHGGKCTNIHVVNNIILPSEREGIYFDGATSENSIIKNNVVYQPINSGSDRVNVNSGSWNISNNYLGSSPGFVSTEPIRPTAISRPFFPVPEAGQFQPSSTSPLRSAGVLFSENTTDYIENFYSSPPSIGVLEYGSEVSVLPVPTNLHPNGTLVKLAGDPTVYLVSGSSLKGFRTPSEFLSNDFSWDMVIEIENTKFSKYSAGGFVDIQSGTLVTEPGNPTVWLINDGKLYGFSDPQTFLGLGYSWGAIMEIMSNESTNYAWGGLMEVTSQHFDYTKIKTATNPTVYLLEYVEGVLVRRPMSSPSIFFSQGWIWTDVLEISDKEMATYLDGDQLFYRDATIVMEEGKTYHDFVSGSAPCYVVEYEKKRQFSESSQFLAMGYNDGQILFIPRSEIIGIETGDYL